MTQYPNWHAMYAEPLFEKYLLPLAGKPGLRFLQIGAFTGDASLWMLRNVLTGDGCTLTDVDTWQGSDEPEHGAFDWADVERIYDERMRGFVARGRLIKFKGTNSDFYQSANSRYDFIYIDGDHTAIEVSRDASCAYLLADFGALIAFDDYQWVPRAGTDAGPGRAIDNFLRAYRPSIKVLERGAQVWISK